MLISSIVIYALGIIFIILFIVAKVSKKKRIAKKEKKLAESIQVLKPVEKMEETPLVAEVKSTQTPEVADESI